MKMTVTERANHAKALRAEGKKFLNAFGLQGAIWFAESVSFEDARARWQKMLEKEFRQLTQKIGPHAARFAADMKLKNQLDKKINEKLT